MKKFLSGLKASFTTRSFRVGGYSVVATAIVLAIIVAANLLVQALPQSITKLDTTAIQMYTLSDQTEQILDSLDKDVTIYWIVQGGYEDTTLKPLLERYDTKSDRVSIEKIDPDLYPTFVETYADGEVTNNCLVVMCGERRRFVGDEDIYVENYTDYYTTGEIAYDFAGENAITSAIDFVVSENLPKVYTLTGHGEVALSSGFADALDSENILTDSLSLITTGGVPTDADAVLILAPESDISEDEKAMLAAYAQAGGNLMYISTPPQDTVFTNLNSLMGRYGISVQDGVLVEGNPNYYMFEAPYYLLPVLQSHAITAPLTEDGYKVLLPIAQGLTIAQELPENVTASSLLISSTASFSKAAGLNLTTYEKEAGDTDGPFHLAVAAEHAIDEETVSHGVWISCPMILDESTNAQISGGNMDFFLNAINWMCEQEDRISIRVKSLAYETLTITRSVATAMAIAVVAVIPLSFLAVGIIIWFRRRRK